MELKIADMLDEADLPLDGSPMGLLLSAQAQLRPADPAVTCAGQTWSFAQYEANANRIARLMLDLGVAQGDRVAFALSNRAEYGQAVYAAWKIGAVPCPVSSRLTAVEWDETITLIDPRAIVGTSVTHDAQAPLIDVDAAAWQEMPDHPLIGSIAEPGRILTSGGSTGRPKLIVDPVPSVWGRDKRLPYRPAQTVSLVAGPLSHSAPFVYGINAIAEGTHVVLMDRFDPEEWLRLVERHRVVTTTVVPTMMSRIAKLGSEITDRYDLSSLAFLMHSAAPCPPDIKRWWIDRIGANRIWEVYGGTERLGAAIINGEEWLGRPGSVGRPVPGDRIVILGEDHQPLPTGEIGEIFFERAGGAGRSYSYIGSDARIRANLDSFGDMGWLDEDGYLFIADRRTDMVLIGGVNVFPAEIEAAIEGLAGVLGAAVIGLPDADRGNRLHAIVELAEGVPLPEDAQHFLVPASARLAPFKRPSSVEFTYDRIRDDAGKVRRSTLRQERLTPT